MLLVILIPATVVQQSNHQVLKPFQEFTLYLLLSLRADSEIGRSLFSETWLEAV